VKASDVEIRVELGADIQDKTVEQSFIVPASDHPVQFKVRSFLFTGGVRSMRTPEFYASLRRREIQRLHQLVNDLRAYEREPHFAVRTYPIIERIAKLLEALTESPTEGNSREILRQIRDTILDGGWEKYRKEDVRQTILGVLQKAGQAEEVPPRLVDECFDLLYDRGLTVVGPFPIDVQETSEVPG
jgi:hypothetical protein